MKDGFVHIAVDDYWNKGSLLNQKSLKTDRFYSQKDREHLLQSSVRLLMFEEGQKNKSVYDDIDQTILDFYKKNNIKIYIVILYASPTQLIMNINARRLYDPRGKWVFNQYEKYMLRLQDLKLLITSIRRALFLSCEKL